VSELWGVVCIIVGMIELIHGDCLEEMKKIPDGSVDLVLTDIPYGEVTKNGAERAKYSGQLRKIDKGVADSLTFDVNSLLLEIKRVSCGSVYIFCGIEQIQSIYTFFAQEKDFMVRQCVWRKTNPAPVNGQHLWLSSFENCIFAKRRKTKFNQSCKSSVWDFPTGRSKVHPTEKPLSLFEYLLQSSSDEGDTVLDMCMGSGTTGVACKNLNRNFIGIELDAEYYEMAKKRIDEA
jgi:site-specific DNA-methyltransferase (adenine-specific)